MNSHPPQVVGADGISSIPHRGTPGRPAGSPRFGQSSSRTTPHARLWPYHAADGRGPAEPTPGLAGGVLLADQTAFGPALGSQQLGHLRTRGRSGPVPVPDVRAVAAPLAGAQRVLLVAYPVGLATTTTCC